MKINLTVSWTVVTLGTHCLCCLIIGNKSGQFYVLRKIAGVILVDIKIVKLNQYYDKLNLL